MASHGLDAALIQQIIERGGAIWLFTGGPEPTAFHLMDEGKPHRRRMFVLPDQAEARSGRAPEPAARRVAIIGAGSVGSKIAEILVRSGISRLTLVDGDVMLPGSHRQVSLERSRSRLRSRFDELMITRGLLHGAAVIGL